MLQCTILTFNPFHLEAIPSYICAIPQELESSGLTAYYDQLTVHHQLHDVFRELVLIHFNLLYYPRRVLVTVCV